MNLNIYQSHPELSDLGFFPVDMVSPVVAKSKEEKPEKEKTQTEKDADEGKKIG